MYICVSVVLTYLTAIIMKQSEGILKQLLGTCELNELNELNELDF